MVASARLSQSLTGNLFRVDMKKARDDFSLSIYWHRQTPHKEINSPLPRLIGYRYPLVGEWIYDKHERFIDRLPSLY